MRNMVREGKVYQTHPKELLILFSQLLIALLLGEDRKMHFGENVVCQNIPQLPLTSG